MSKPASLTLLLLILSLAATPARGQSNYASLSGTVYDPQRQAVPGATVQLTSVSTRASRQVSTNGEGLFQLSGLLPGEYTLEVQAEGFSTLTRTVTLEVGQPMTLDIGLTLSSLSAVVDVSGQEAVLRTAD